MDTLNLAYFNQREKKSRGSWKIMILGKKILKLSETGYYKQYIRCMTSVTVITPAEYTFYANYSFN